jgi:serine/threonine protein kinase
MVGSFTCKVLHLSSSTERYIEIYSRVSADLSARCAGQDSFVTVAFNCLQLAEGLNCLHTLGFTHCDLKPTNVGYQCLSCSSVHASTDSVTSGGFQGSAPPASTGLGLRLQLPGSQELSTAVSGGSSSKADPAGRAGAGSDLDELPAGGFQFTAVRILDWGLCRRLPRPQVRSFLHSAWLPG